MQALTEQVLIEQALWLLSAIWCGFLLDLAFGDPYWMPHPVRFIGMAINGFEKILRKQFSGQQGERFAGVLLLVVIAGGTYSFYWAVIVLSQRYLGHNITFMIQSFMVYQLFAVKCLGDEGKKVLNKLLPNDLQGARMAVSWLVSRDVDVMEREDVIKATIETISENTIDGIITPMFFLFIGGIPLAYAFKAVSTLDSMVGYKNDKYIWMGWASARTDDWMNYIPSRLTGPVIAFMAAVMGFDGKNALRIMWRDRKNHSSPNSPWSEAAFAGALGIQLGGRASYFGKMSIKPTMGDLKNPYEVRQIQYAIRLMYATAIFFMLLMTLAYVWYTVH